MKMGTMLRDIVESFFKKYDTRLYPFERSTPPNRFRGTLMYNPAACTGCGLCVKDCPANAIQLITLDRAAKRFVVKYRMDRCIYCGQCVLSCKFKCISMPSQNWEHAALEEKGFALYYGSDQDIAQVLAGSSAPATGPVKG